MPAIRGENPLTCSEGRGRNSRGTETGASNSTASQDNSDPRVDRLMEEVLSKENMSKAMKRVEANKGAAGIDDMTVSEGRRWEDTVTYPAIPAGRSYGGRFDKSGTRGHAAGRAVIAAAVKYPAR